MENLIKAIAHCGFWKGLQRPLPKTVTVPRKIISSLIYFELTRQFRMAQALLKAVFEFLDQPYGGF